MRPGRRRAVEGAGGRALAAPVLAAAALAAHPARAHGFGERFDLPLPLWLWLAGAAATILFTFVALALFARGGGRPAQARERELLRTPAARGMAHFAATVLRVAGVLLFALVVDAGLRGSQDAYANVAVVLVWVWWWVGLAFVSALVADVWEVMDPLQTLARVGGALSRRLLGRRPWPALGYPAALGAWPAVLLFVGFAWAELVWHGKDTPALLAKAVLGYAAITWAGMAIFGTRAWHEHGDPFALAFRVLGRYAPLAVRPGRPGAPASLVLRPWAAGLETREPVTWSVAVFVLLMLSTVTYDGFHQTPLMERIDTAAQTTRSVALLLYALSGWGLEEAQWVHTAVLLAFPLAFVALYAVTARAMDRLACGPVAPSEKLAAARDAQPVTDRPGSGPAMVLTLVPIAVAYHLSHYFTLLLTAGQFAWPLASDPYGRGWDLFGTRGYAVDLNVVSPYVYWYGSVLLIVVGHVQAVVLAHRQARRLYGTHAAAVRSQVPMVLLMMAYTSLSLWIMAQPVVG